MRRFHRLTPLVAQTKGALPHVPTNHRHNYIQITNVTERQPTSESLRSEERRSALDRIAESDLREQLQRRSTPSRDSGRLQEVEILYEDTQLQDTTLATMMQRIPSSPHPCDRCLLAVEGISFVY